MTVPAAVARAASSSPTASSLPRGPTRSPSARVASLQAAMAAAAVIRPFPTAALKSSAPKVAAVAGHGRFVPARAVAAVAALPKTAVIPVPACPGRATPAATVPLITVQMAAAARGLLVESPLATRTPASPAMAATASLRPYPASRPTTPAAVAEAATTTIPATAVSAAAATEPTPSPLPQGRRLRSPTDATNTTPRLASTDSAVVAAAGTTTTTPVDLAAAVSSSSASPATPTPSLKYPLIRKASARHRRHTAESPVCRLVILLPSPAARCR